MWTEKVRKNPEELINYIPELFPDDPNNNNNWGTFEKSFLKTVDIYFNFY